MWVAIYQPLSLQPPLLLAPWGKTRPQEPGNPEASSYVSQENRTPPHMPQESTAKSQTLSVLLFTQTYVSIYHLPDQVLTTVPRANPSSSQYWVWDSAGEVLHELNGATELDGWGSVLSLMSHKWDYQSSTPVQCWQRSSNSNTKLAYDPQIQKET